MTAIMTGIERARIDLEDALGDLGAAARELTPAHWKARAEQAFQRRPGRVLAAMFLAGFWFGHRAQ